MLSLKLEKRAIESLVFLAEKGDGEIKAQTVANGSMQRSHMIKEEASSLVVATERLLLSEVIDEKESYEAITLDSPNGFS